MEVGCRPSFSSGKSSKEMAPPRAPGADDASTLFVSGLMSSSTKRTACLVNGKIDSRSCCFVHSLLMSLRPVSTLESEPSGSTVKSH